MNVLVVKLYDHVTIYNKWSLAYLKAVYAQLFSCINDNLLILDPIILHWYLVPQNSMDSRLGPMWVLKVHCMWTFLSIIKNSEKICICC